MDIGTFKSQLTVQCRVFTADGVSKKDQNEYKVTVGNEEITVKVILERMYTTSGVVREKGYSAQIITKPYQKEVHNAARNVFEICKNINICFDDVVFD